MKVFSFPKGIKVPVPSKREIKTIETIDFPKKLILPLKQHKGKECASLVKKGKEVKRGEIIGKNLAVAVHSPVAGKVSEIKKNFYTLSGDKSQAVIIEQSSEKADFSYLKELGLLGKLLEGGIVDYSPPILPLLKKIEIAQQKRPKFFIINGLEEFFVFGSRASLILEKKELIIEGIRAIKQVLPFDKVYLVIYKDILKELSSVQKDYMEEAEIIPVLPKHPQHKEKIVLLSIFKEIYPPNGTPEDLRCFILDLETVYSVGKLLKEKTPCLEKVVTVSGTDLKEVRSVIVPLGTPISFVLEQLNFNCEEIKKIVINGPISGKAIFDMDYPITKEINQIFILKEKETFEFDHRVCIKCGLCVEVCPMNLMPFMISGYSESGNFDLAFKNNIFFCIECGTCSFVCPIKIPLLQWIQTGKYEILQKQGDML